MRLTRSSSTRWAAGVALVVLAAGCGAPAGPAAAPTLDPTAADQAGCDPAAEQARLQATFERTSSCAIDALTAGTASTIKLAGETVSDTKKIVDAIRAIADQVVVTDLSTARAILCVRTVTAHITSATARAAIVAAAAQLTDEEIDTIWGSLEGSFTFGVEGVFEAYDQLDADPSGENLASFVIAFGRSVAGLGKFLTSCAPVLAPYGVVSIPAVAKYAQAFGDAGTIGAIASCGMAAIGNAVDVGTELSCLADDLAQLRQQYEALQNGNDARCETLADFAANPALRPALQNGGGDPDERASICAGIISRWGSCVYDSGLSCDECARVCEAYVNGAGDYAYLQSTIDAAAAKTGADAVAVERLVQTAAWYCGPQALRDGVVPCVHFCRGQVADCP